MNTIEQNIRARKSTRRFREKDIPEEVIFRIVEAATYAPTSCNRQLWHFVAIHDPKLKKELVEKTVAYQPYIMDAPVVIAVFYDIRQEKNDPFYAPYQSVGMAVQNMMLVA
ncbi:unnamed protein product, partial [marine sediment metagenome]